MITPPSSHRPGAVGEYYDGLDFFFRDVWGEHLHHGLWENGGESVEEATGNLAHRAIAECGVQPGDRVIDIGSGYGATARMMARDPGATVVGYTVSAVQYAAAVAQSPPGRRVRFVLGDWLKNCEEQSSADGVVTIECLSHVGDKRRFLDEVARVLRPGGRAVHCGWLAADGAPGFIERHVLAPVCEAGNLAGLATEHDLTTLSEASGLVLERFDDVGSKVRRTWPLIAWRALQQFCVSPRYRRRLVSKFGWKDVALATAVGRITAAYYAGWIRYGIVVWRKA